MLKFKDFCIEAKKMKGEDPCWKGYEMIGKKKKNGREVPNCVPVKENKEEPNAEPISKNENKSSSRFWGTKSLANIYRKDTPGQNEEVEHIDEVRTELRADPKEVEKVQAEKERRQKVAQKMSTNLKKYQSGQVRANWYKEEKESAPIKSHHSVEDIAKKHKIDVDSINDQLKMGIKIEKEHTNDTDTAKDIALQHLWEKPNYYTKLKKVEESRWPENYQHKTPVHPYAKHEYHKLTDSELNDKMDFHTKEIKKEPSRYNNNYKYHKGEFDAAQSIKNWREIRSKRKNAHSGPLSWYKKTYGVDITEEVLNERGADSKGYYRSTESGAGLTRKGAKHFGIKTAVTTPPSKLKKGGKAWKRRKSFCARMSGMKGPMKDEKGRPTRKAMSLRRWNCH